MKFPKNIINFAFSLYAKKYQKTHIREKRFMDYSHITSILLLFESNLSENHKIIHEVIKELSHDNKHVTAYGFVPKKQAMTPSTFNFNILDYEKTNCLLRPDKVLLQNMSETEFDLVIDLTTRSIVPTDYLLVVANAKCKVGKKKSDIAQTDFMIDLPQKEVSSDEMIDLSYNEERYLFDQIIFYLKQITAK
ncbi:MAG: hypothetical protein EOM76_01145 [Sphingobacteriia bacterium]|jgi:hypothetical protein|nr:hypothetical protein [Paludibacteraceae bacterium]NCA78790.1 hypothetical protein [Sphingobacteriia bacterium]